MHVKKIVTCRICGTRLKNSADCWARIRHWREHHSDCKVDPAPVSVKEKSFLEHLLKDKRVSNPTSQDVAAQSLERYCHRRLSKSSNSACSTSESCPDMLAPVLHFAERRANGYTPEEIAANERPVKDRRKKVLRCKKCGQTYENAFDALLHHSQCAATPVKNIESNKLLTAGEESAPNTKSLAVFESGTVPAWEDSNYTQNDMQTILDNNLPQSLGVCEPSTVDCTDVLSSMQVLTSRSDVPADPQTCEPRSDASIEPSSSLSCVQASKLADDDDALEAEFRKVPDKVDSSLDNASNHTDECKAPSDQFPVDQTLTVRSEHNTYGGSCIQASKVADDDAPEAEFRKIPDKVDSSLDNAATNTDQCKARSDQFSVDQTLTVRSEHNTYGGSCIQASEVADNDDALEAELRKVPEKVDSSLDNASTKTDQCEAPSDQFSADSTLTVRSEHNTYGGSCIQAPKVADDDDAPEAELRKVPDKVDSSLDNASTNTEQCEAPSDQFLADSTLTVRSEHNTYGGSCIQASKLADDDDAQEAEFCKVPDKVDSSLDNSSANTEQCKAPSDQFSGDLPLTVRSEHNTCGGSCIQASKVADDDAPEAEFRKIPDQVDSSLDNASTNTDECKAPSDQFSVDLTLRSEHDTCGETFPFTSDKDLKNPVNDMGVNTKASDDTIEVEQASQQKTVSPTAPVQNERRQANINERLLPENTDSSSTESASKRAVSFIQLLSDLTENYGHPKTTPAGLPEELPICEAVKLHPRQRKSFEAVSDNGVKGDADSNLPHAVNDCGSKKKTKKHPLKRSRSVALTSAPGHKKIKLLKKDEKSELKTSIRKRRKKQDRGKEVEKSASVDLPQTHTKDSSSPIERTTEPVEQSQDSPSPPEDPTATIQKPPSVWDELIWNSTKETKKHSTKKRSTKRISSSESSDAETSEASSAKRRRQSARKSCPSKSVDEEDSDDDCILIETVMPIAVNRSAQVVWCPPEPLRIDDIEIQTSDPCRRMVHRKVIIDSSDNESIELEQVAKDLGIRLPAQKKNVTARKSTRSRPQSETSKTLMNVQSNSFECHLCGKIITMKNLDAHWKNECNKGRA